MDAPAVQRNLDHLHNGFRVEKVIDVRESGRRPPNAPELEHLVKWEGIELEETKKEWEKESTGVDD